MNDRFNAAQALKALIEGRQHNRLMRGHFPHKDGPDALFVPEELDAFEALSCDFHFRVLILSDDAGIELKDVQGKMFTVEVVREDGTLRFYNGYVFEFRLVETDGAGVLYEMVLLPWMAYLRLRIDYCTFQNENLHQRITKILRNYKVADWQSRAIGAYDEPVTYACQFDETDHNVLHRWLEKIGVHYWYEHRKDGHTLIFSSDSMQADPIDGETPDIPWQSEAGSQEDDGISDWTPVRRIVPSRVTRRSFDFKNPRPQEASVPTINQQGDVLSLEVYDYAAYGFKDSSEGDAQVRQRMEEIEASGKHFEARANDRFVMPGRWFRLTGHFDSKLLGDDPDQEFLIRQATHTVRNNYLQNGIPSSYRNTFTCIRKKISWRPSPGFVGVEPKIYGLQTAIVCGPKGEEIHTDKYGRIKVQFHWDRVGEYDEKSSAWVRVASVWTGNGYGFIGVPRIGQEVVVQFLEGNPDLPLVTSCVFNERNMPPWGLPDASHQTGLQTRSTPGGNGYCEVVIHDKAGHELINIYSQKDMVTTVLNDQSTTVNHNQATVVNGSQQTIAVTQGTQATTVKKAIQTVSETEHIQLMAHTAIELGAQTAHIVLKAATDLVLEVGKSKIHMSQDGTILIEGVNVTVKGSGKVDVNP